VRRRRAPSPLPQGAAARACSGWTVGHDGGGSSAARWRRRWRAWSGTRLAAARGRCRRWLVAALGVWARSGPGRAERVTAPARAREHAVVAQLLRWSTSLGAPPVQGW
jgi:hypothetical protein